MQFIPSESGVPVPARAGKSLVLCIDDDFGVLESLRRLLRQEAYDIVTASSPAQALALVRRRVPDVIVSDERMPEASGSEFLADVRARWPWIGRVILTAYPGPEILVRSLEAGVDLLLYKPWDGAQLKQTLGRLMREVERARSELNPGAAGGGAFDLGGEGG